jgi:hypothetical protein
MAASVEKDDSVLKEVASLLDGIPRPLSNTSSLTVGGIYARSSPAISRSCSCPSNVLLGTLASPLKGGGDLFDSIKRSRQTRVRGGHEPSGDGDARERD